MLHKQLWYWDSCVLIGVLKKEPDKIKILRDLLYQADAGKALIIFSAWSFFEVMHLGNKNLLDAALEKSIRDFMQRSCFQVRNLDRRIAEYGREIVWQQAKNGIQITAKDAPHLATASLVNADVLHTYDPVLLSLSEKLLRDDGKPLKIQIPFLDQDLLDL